MVTLDSFGKKIAYVIGHTDGGLFLERVPIADKEAELARGGLVNLGFAWTEV